jgi:hypothetical protein
LPSAFKKIAGTKRIAGKHFFCSQTFFMLATLFSVYGKVDDGYSQKASNCCQQGFKLLSAGVSEAAYLKAMVDQSKTTILV